MHKKTKFAFEPMEPRLLFSADLDGGLVSGAPDDHAALLDPALTQALVAVPPAGADGEIRAAGEIRQELVLVDTDTPDYQQLVDDLLANDDATRHLEVILLDNTRDGIHQVTEILSYHRNLDAVHIISHGMDGAIDLGGSTLDSTSLLAGAGIIETWGGAFTAEADFLIYGCNLAASAAGQSLVTALAGLTGADVAASDDLTGSAALGGDWALEYATGVVETDVAVSAGLQGDYQHTLAVFNVTTNANAGAGSLRQAIIDANAAGGADTINLNTLLPINLTSGSLTITSDITIVGTGATANLINGDGTSRVFDINAGTVSISGVTITGGSENDGGAISTQAGSTLNLTDVALSGNIASNSGGAIYNRGTLNLDRVTISGNTAAGNGAGIHFANGSVGSLINVTVSDNNAPGGAALRIFNASVTIVNSTIAYNSEGISAGGSAIIDLQNTILAENTGRNSDATLTSSGNNIDSDGTAGLSGAGDQSGSIPSPIDVKLGGLQNNGGQTLTHALLAGSLAINNGNDAGAPGTDQRGSVRVGTTDIGAFEAGPGVLAAVDDVASTDENTPVIIDVLGNDNGASKVLDYTLPANGTVTDNGDGTLTYKPDFGYDGPDSFKYVITDGTDGATHYWNLDGNALDSIGSNDGVVVDATPVAGHYGGALSFDEVDDHVVIPDFSYANDFSVSFRFKVDDNSGSLFQYIYSHAAADASNSLNIYIGESGHGSYANMMMTNIEDPNDGNGGAALNVDIGAGGLNIIGDGQWHTYTLTVESGVGSKVYIDGVPGNSSARGADGINPGTDVHLGANNNFNVDRFYGGGLDSVQVFDRTLGAPDTAALHAGTLLSTSTATVDITVNPAAPVTGVANTVPGNQNVDEDASLVFSTGTGNAITVDDGTTADPELRTTLTVTNGTLTLATTLGLSFDSGADGTASMTIHGDESAINAALDGLTFTPTGGYDGPADLQVTTDLGAHLLGNYTFDGSSPGENASDPGTNDGNVNGNPTTVFDGSRNSDVLVLDGNDNIQIPGRFGDPADVTLAAWVNLDAARANDELISIGNSVALRLDDTNNGDGVTGFFWDGSTWQHTDSSVYVSGSGWHHVAYTFDDAANEQTIYVDGVALLTTNYTGSIAYSLNPDTALGSHPSGSFGLSGRLDDAHIYERALEAGEIAALASDLNSASNSVAITVDPVNDTPVVGDVSVNADEDGPAVTGSFVLTSDPDTGDTHTFDITSTLAEGTVINNNDGTFSFDPGGDFQDLAAGATRDVTFTYTATDNSGAPNATSTSATVTVTVTGSNDSASVSGTDTGAVTEDVDPDLDGLLETSGAMTVTDMDNGEANFTAGTIAGTYGSITIDAAGNWSYAADNTQAAIQSLPVGATLNDTITVTTTDGTTHDVVITHTGANDAPVIGGVDTGTVTEDVDPDLDGLLETSGALTISDTDTGEANFTAGTVAGTYGSVTLDAAGNWTYATDNTQAAIQALAAGATLNDTITVTTTDGTTHDIEITITGANDTPVIGGVDTGAVTEDVDPDLDGLLETTGGLTITDADTGEANFTAGTIAGTYGSITLDAAGNWSYAADNTQAAIQNLAAGATLTDTLTISSADGTTHAIVMTIDGANSAAVIGGVDTGAVTEDVDPDLDGLLETGGALTIADEDSGEASFTAGTVIGTYGDLTLDAAGNWTYAADNTQAAIQSLAGGATVTDTLTVISVDGTTHDVVITLTGANDIPVIGGVDTGAVTEDVDPDLDGLLETGGTLTITDTDTGEANFTAGTIAGTYGDVTIDAAGNWAYAADNTLAAIQALTAGSTLTDTITVSSADGTTHDLVMTINGANSAAVIGGVDTGAVTEDVDPDLDGLLETSGTLTIADADSGEATFNAGTVVGTYGSITINAAGTWFYAADNTQAAIQSLAAGATLTDTITVTTADGTTHDVVITITGTNDAAVISGVDTGSVTEDVGVSGGKLTTAGRLTISDTDAGEAGFAAGTVSGAYGDLSIDAAGNWSYGALNSQTAIQSLAVGATLTDILIVTSADGTAHDVVVVITGTNDAPTVANPNANQVATIDDLFSFTFALTTFNDIDGDNLTFTATQGDGSALPGWLSFDAATRTLSGTPTSAEAGLLVLKITADDGQGGTVSDVFDLKVTDDPGGPIVIIEVPDPGPDIEPAPDPEVIGPPVGTTDPDPGDGKDPGKDPGLPSVGGEVTPVPGPGAGDTVPPGEPAPETDRPGDPKNTIPAEPGPQVKHFDTTNDYSYGRAGMTAKALMRVSAFVQELDDARQVMSEKATLEQRIVGSTMTVTTGLSVGYVIWLIRGGVLLSSVLSSLPAWRMIDPLPVLAFTRLRSEDEAEDESLESLVNKGGRGTRPQRDPANDGSAGGGEEDQE